jgi:serine/threonine-protein kinase
LATTSRDFPGLGQECIFSSEILACTIHRDLKPGNIMLVPEASGTLPERVKLLDFGIAKLDAQSLNLEDPLTRTGALMGTPHYMSPEQCRGARGVDDRADVYSLGVIIFQMLAGRLPFIGDGGEGTVMAMHIYEPPPKPREFVPTISEPLQELVLQMLRKEPEARPSMFLVTRRLEELGAAMGMNSELSITLEDAPPGAGNADGATLMAPPAGSAANTVLLSSSANRSFPSQPSTLGALTGQVGTSPTLGPVTGQVAAVVRYRRPLVAGAVGVLGLLAAVGLLVALLRHPTPPVAAAGEGDAQLELARGPSGDDHGTGAPEPQRSGNPGEATSPGSASPKPPAAAVRSPAAHGKPAKRRVPKRKPKAKPGGKSTTPSKPTVSVVD